MRGVSKASVDWVCAVVGTAGAAVPGMARRRDSIFRDSIFNGPKYRRAAWPLG